jgi:hypothetical protein
MSGTTSRPSGQHGYPWRLIGARNFRECLLVFGWFLRRILLRPIWAIKIRGNLLLESLLLVVAILLSLPSLFDSLSLCRPLQVVSATIPWLASPLRALSQTGAKDLFPLWLAWAAMYATRRLAANQLGPKLLERLNSDAMYASRRKTYSEMFWWCAGDRLLLIQFECETPYWAEVSVKEITDDRSVGISQVLGFIIELRTYFFQGLLGRRVIRVLLRDRFSWFVWFFRQFAEEIKACHDQFVEDEAFADRARMPFPFVYGPRSVRWLCIVCQLEYFAHPKTYRSARGEGPQIEPVPKIFDDIQGLHHDNDLKDYKILLDSNVFAPGTIFARRNKRSLARGWDFDVEGSGGFIRLRVKRDASDWRHFLLLDVGVPRPTSFERFINYLDYEDARTWYERLYLQGARPFPNVSNPFDVP